MKKTHLFLILAGLYFLTMLTGCGDTTPQIYIQGYTEDKAAATLTIEYKLKDMDGSSVDVFSYYSIDGGVTFLNATAASEGSGTSGLDPGADGTEYTFVWDYGTDIGTGRIAGVYFKMQGKDDFRGKAKKIGPLTLGNALLFITTYDDGGLSVFNTSSGEVDANSESGRQPGALVVNSQGTKVYVANYAGDTIRVYDVAAAEFTNSVNVGINPSALTISPDGNELYVTLENENLLKIYDIDSLNLLNSFSTGAAPKALAFTPDNSALYVANSMDNTVWIYDTSDLSDDPLNVPVEKIPVDMAFVDTTNSTMCCLVTRNEGNASGVLEVFDVDDPNGTHTLVTVGVHPVAVAAPPLGGFVFVTNYEDGTISIVRVGSRIELDSTVELDDTEITGPRDIVLGKDGLALYIACYLTEEIYEVSTTTFEVQTTTYSVEGGPYAMAASPFLWEE